MLQIKDVSVQFGDNPEVVSGADMQICNGEHLAIIGETGSGKSVLLQAVLGILPKSARISGSITLDGKELLCCSQREYNRIRGQRIAYIPQGSGNGLNPLYTIGHQLCETIRRHSLCSRKEALARAVVLLESFGLENGTALCKNYPFQLSGGMRQRVLVAMGIGAGADLVLADEPTKGLDQRRIAQVADAFGQLGDRTLVCVTHDLRFARTISTHVVVMYASQQIESGSSVEFFGQPLHPYSCAMLAALPENGLQTNMGFAPSRENAVAQSGCHFYERCPYACEKCIKMPPMVTVGQRKVRCWKYAD